MEKKVTVNCILLGVKPKGAIGEALIAAAKKAA